jgi:hypothetical protein
MFDDNDKQVTTHFFSPNPFENGAFRATWQHSRDTSTVWGQLMVIPEVVDERNRILLGRPAAPVEKELLAASVTRELRAAGAEPPRVHVEIVDAVTRTKPGKAPLIKALSPREPPRSAS